MSEPKLIVCGVDLRQGGDRAIVEADAWARREGGRVLFVHAIFEPSRSHVLFPQLSQRALQSFPYLARLAADAVSGRVSALTGREGSSVESVVEMGSPAAILVNEAEKARADVIVIGATGESQGVGPLGSVALRVVRHAHCPVLVARASPEAGPVVAASDLSDPAFPAIGAGAAMAASLGADFHVVHAVDFPPPVPMSPETVGLGLGQGATEQEMQLLREAARDGLDSAMRRIGLTVRGIIDDGLPAVAVLRNARRLGARLLVIGTEGRTGLRRMLLGSTAEQILREAPCSVLVVRLHSHGDPS
ncbi:MAG: universal stress protein [Vicinamibacteria bacterium]